MKKRSVVIKKSTLPGAGLGLFAARDFAKGERITAYHGRRVRWKDVKHTDGHNGYLLRLNRTTAIDAQPFRKTAGRYANDALGIGRVPGLKNNAEYLIYGDRCYIESTRAIQKGEEILVSYGRAFWDLQRKLARKAS